VLRTRAKDVHRPISGALFVEPPPPSVHDYQPHTYSSQPEGRSSGASALWIVAVIVLAVIRLAGKGCSSSSSDYSPSSDSPPYSSYNRLTEEALRHYSASETALELATPRVDEQPVSDGEPPPFRKKATPTEQADEVYHSLLLVMDQTVASESQLGAMRALYSSYPFHHECVDTREEMALIEDQLGRRGDAGAYVDRHIKAMRLRVDRLCPKKTKKKAAAPKVEVEP